MRRLNFTLDEETVGLLEKLARQYYDGNKSRTVRAALESLAAHTGHEGWVVTGYVPVAAEGDVACHTCGGEHHAGEVLYRPVFERGRRPGALSRMPSEVWLECTSCAEEHLVTGP